MIPKLPVEPRDYAFVAERARICRPKRTLEWDTLSTAVYSFTRRTSAMDAPAVCWADKDLNPREEWSADAIGKFGLFVVRNMPSICRYANLDGMSDRDPAMLRRFCVQAGNWMIGCGETGQGVVVQEIPTSEIDITLYPKK